MALAKMSIQNALMSQTCWQGGGSGCLSWDREGGVGNGLIRQHLLEFSPSFLNSLGREMKAGVQRASAPSAVARKGLVSEDANRRSFVFVYLFF